MRLAGALGWFWYRRAERTEGRRWLERVLALPGAQQRSAARAWLLFRQAEEAIFEGGIAAGRDKFEESLALFEALHDTYGSATVQFNLALAARELGDVALAQGDLTAATTRFAASLPVFQQGGDAGCWSLAGLAGAAALGGQGERAARLWGAAEAVRERTGKRAAPASRATYERVVATTRTALGTEGFAAAWAAGRAMTLEQAVLCADERDDEAAGAALAPGEAGRVDGGRVHVRRSA